MNITSLKSALDRKLRGAKADDVQGVSDYSLFKEAGVNVMNEMDPAETVRRATLNIFDGIYDYTPAADVKELIDVRPQTYERYSDDRSRRRFIEDFDFRKRNENNDFSLEYLEGTKILRYARDVGNSISVAETLDDNWTAGTGVSNIAEDTIIFSENSRSLRFDASSGSNLITWAITTPKVDLSTHTQKSSFFLWVYYPDSSLITSLTLRVGSSASDYYEITGTIHFGSIRSGWNLYRFDWSGVSDSGTTDEANTDYVRLALVTTATATNIRIGKLTSKLPTPREYVYYSYYLFRSSSGTFKEVPTVDTDVVNLDTDGENIFLLECARIAARELSNDKMKQDYTEELFGNGRPLERGGTVGLYARYRARRPSDSKPVVTAYSGLPNFHRR